VLLAVGVMFFVVSIQAQAPQGPPKPGPEVNRLAYNIGTWNIVGEAKPFADARRQVSRPRKSANGIRAGSLSRATRKAQGRWASEGRLVS